MTKKERKRKKREYIDKVIHARGISFVRACQLAIVKEYNRYVDTIKEINSR